MFSLKFQPWTLRKLFEIKISDYTNKVLLLETEKNPILSAIKKLAIQPILFDEKVQAIENLLLKTLNLKKEASNGERAIQLILRENGAINLQDLYNKTGISERSLERYFKEYIGLSPKFYCRIIRFSYIFSLVNQGTINWSDVSFHAGFYDQSHFIKNFKEFTGEEPSRYGFTEETLANFFLSK
jgi:AraC-like DNA-binding protein